MKSPLSSFRSLHHVPLPLTYQLSVSQPAGYLLTLPSYLAAKCIAALEIHDFESLGLRFALISDVGYLFSATKMGSRGAGVSEQDWEKFGLAKKPDAEAARSVEGAEGELYREEQLKKIGDEGEKNWWESNFFLKEPVLFGTWDGVFTSVMVNIFGVIVFLKTGWVVGNAGINDAILILLLCLSLALMPVLSAIGICERCQIQSGGVYFLISHILGGRIGGAVGALYAFGQAVATSLVAIGFGESMAHVLGTDNDWLIRFFAFAVLIALVGINVAGVKWVIKLQLFLLGLLVLALADLVLGVLMTSNPEKGVVGLSAENWHNNTAPDYLKGQNFFSVFGVFFSTFTGVLAGVNMSGDLKDPSRNIPVGQLAAVGATGGFCLLFVLSLGGACGRAALQNDVMIAEQASLTKILFLAGIYVSSLSSILGSLYGAPRVIQSIAAENVIPILKPLEAGRGPNKVPVYATIVLTAISGVFILVREMNTLALIATMPFLITYAYVNYSYVSLAMTFDLQQARFGRIPKDHPIPQSYGSMHGLSNAAENAQNESDLDHLFPERQANKFSTPQPEGALNAEGAALVAASDDGVAADGGGTLLKKESKPSIIHMPRSWYSRLCNRWVALVGAVINLLIIFLAHLGFAFANLLLLAVIYFYIGQAAPGVFPGISEFSIPHSFRVVLAKLRGGNVDDEIIVAPLQPSVQTFADKVTEDNTDYSQRQNFHQTRKTQIDPEFD